MRFGWVYPLWALKDLTFTSDVQRNSPACSHPEWIAKTDEEYINTTTGQKSRSRIKLRQTLREEIKESLLYNSKQFAEDFSDCMES